MKTWRHFLWNLLLGVDLTRARNLQIGFPTASSSSVSTANKKFGGQYLVLT